MHNAYDLERELANLRNYPAFDPLRAPLTVCVAGEHYEILALELTPAGIEIVTKCHPVR